MIIKIPMLTLPASGTRHFFLCPPCPQIFLLRKIFTYGSNGIISRGTVSGKYIECWK